MSTNYDTLAHPCTEDKDGKRVSHKTAVVVQELRENTRNLQVVCHWHESGRIGLWNKSPNVVKEHIDVARDCGYEVDHITTRNKDGKERGYVEFVPQE